MYLYISLRGVRANRRSLTSCWVVSLRSAARERMAGCPPFTATPSRAVVGRSGSRTDSPLTRWVLAETERVCAASRARPEWERDWSVAPFLAWSSLDGGLLAGSSWTGGSFESSPQAAAARDDRASDSSLPLAGDAPWLDGAGPAVAAGMGGSSTRTVATELLGLGLTPATQGGVKPRMDDVT